MSFSRKDFLTLLQDVKPALAGKSDIPGLDAIWFSEHYASAYNGVIQIRTPLPLAYTISGGVPGDVLIKFVASCSTEEMDIDLKKGFTVKAGKAKGTLPILDLTQNSCEFPEIDPREIGGQLPAEFWQAIKRALISTSKNSSREAYTGVMLEPAEKDSLNIYSTDGNTLSWENVANDYIGAWESKLLLPCEFCAQALSVKDDETYFLSDEGYASIVNEDNIAVTTRLLDTDGAPRYKGAIQKHLSDVSSYYPLPDHLRSALERCELIKPDRGEEPVVLDIKNGVMDISITTKTSEARDQVETDHPDCHVTLNADYLLRAIDNYTEFAITEDAFILHGEGTSYHMISTLQD